MATPTVKQHRRNMAALITIALNDIRILTDQFDGDAERTRDQLLDALPRMALIYGAAAAALSADWYDDLRLAARVRGPRLIPELAATAGADVTDPIARWAVGPLFQADPEPALVYARTADSFQQVIADTGRHTVTQTTVADPKAKGWRRALNPGACEYCQTLATVEWTTKPDFQSHGSCGCYPVPSWT